MSPPETSIFDSLLKIHLHYQKIQPTKKKKRQRKVFLSNKKNSKKTNGNTIKYAASKIQKKKIKNIQNKKNYQINKFKKQSKKLQLTQKELLIKNEEQNKEIHQLKNEINTLKTTIEHNYIYAKLSDYDNDNVEYQYNTLKPNDILLLFELQQTVPYKKIKTVINTVQKLSKTFNLPNISWLNKLSRSTKETLNLFALSYVIERGTWAGEDITLGVDGTSVSGIKIHSGNILKYNTTKNKFDRLMLSSKVLYQGNTKGVKEKIEQDFKQLNEHRLLLRKLIQNDQVVRQSCVDDYDSDDDVLDDCREILNKITFVETQEMITYAVTDGSDVEYNALSKNKFFNKLQMVCKCLEHGVEDILRSILKKLSEMRKENTHKIVTSSVGMLKSVNIYIFFL